MELLGVDGELKVAEVVSGLVDGLMNPHLGVGYHNTVISPHVAVDRIGPHIHRMALLVLTLSAHIIDSW